MYSISELAQRLSDAKHFQSIDPAELQKITQLGRIQLFQADEIVFHEGSPSAGLFVLLSGQIQLCKISQQGQIAILAVYDPTIMFNEVAALDQGANPATAMATEATMVWRIDADHLEYLLLRYPQLGVGLLRVLAQRNRHLIGHFEDLSFRSVLARAAKLLLELSVNGTKPIDRRKHPVHQMAARIATVPEAFSRALKVFRGNEDILCTGSTLAILRADHLHEIAELGPRSIEHRLFSPN